MQTITYQLKDLLKENIQPFSSNPIIAPESAMAHKYLDGLKGIEIGPAAYQPFGLDSIGVVPDDQHEKDFYRLVQLRVAWAMVKPDMYGFADALDQIADDSQDYVLSSHVIEHTPNPIACFQEWNRVIKDGGYVYMIFPKREAPYGDQNRKITPMRYFECAYDQSWGLEEAFNLTPDKSAEPRHRCHYWVFNLQSMIELIRLTDEMLGVTWQLIEAHDTDDKDGLGHMVIYRVRKGKNNGA